MSIEAQKTITLASAEVSDEYQVELTVRDDLTYETATVSLTWSQTQDLVDELLAAQADAVAAFSEDQARRPIAAHGFDRDAVICRDCSEGKHGACIGSAHVERGEEIDEVDCMCTADGHRGRS